MAVDETTTKVPFGVMAPFEYSMVGTLVLQLEVNNTNMLRKESDKFLCFRGIFIFPSLDHSVMNLV